MKPLKFDKRPHIWKQKNWGRTQMRYFGEECKIRREKNIEDFILHNGHQRIHTIKDNAVLDKFFTDHNIEIVPMDQADLILITDQRFSRFDVKVILDKLNKMLELCPRIYFNLNWYYFNANESYIDSELPESYIDGDWPENYNNAITTWFNKNLNNAIVINCSTHFNDDGSYFSWVIPPCELIICRK